MEPTQVEPRDSAFFALDGPTTNGAINFLLLLDGPITLAELREQVAAGLPRVPELRRRLLRTPLRGDQPWWIDDPEFDISAHVDQTEVPQPGGPRAVAATAALLGARPLDRHRPLWALHLLQIPERGERPAASAILAAVHHAMADGRHVGEILEALLSAPPRSREHREPWLPDPEPDGFDLVRQGALGVLPRVQGGMVELGRSTVRALVDGWQPPVVHAAPRTAFNRAATAGRTFAFGALPLAASRRTRVRHCVSVNDVFHAAVAGGLRQWLLRRDALPDRPLVALLPISHRHLTADHSGANRIGITGCQLPTHVADPAERLFTAHDALGRARGAPLMTERGVGVVARAVAPTLGQLARLASSLRLMNAVPSPFNLLVSSVPMGDLRLRVAGRQVTGVHPMPPIFDGLALNVTAQGYRGSLNVGIFACASALPDPWELLTEVSDAYRQVCRV